MPFEDGGARSPETVKAAIAVELEPHFAKEAKARQKQAGREAGRGRPKKVVANLPQPKRPAPQARDQAAAVVGVSGKSVADAKALAERSEPAEKIENGDGAVTTDAPSAPWLEPYRWKKGESGNRGGRIGRLAQRVREATHDGDGLVRFLVKVVNDGNERTRDRLHAAEMLLSRGWGKAVLPVALRALIEDRLEDRRPERPAFNMDYFASLDRQTQRTFLDVLKRLRQPSE